MITIFTTAKAFTGHTGIIQENALRSWVHLLPACDVVLFGDDRGSRETADALGVRHVADVRVNEWGTPLVSDLFTKAESLSDSDLFCYANADVLFFDDLVEACFRARSRKKRFLMIGRRTNLDVVAPIDWSDETALRLRELARLHGRPGDVHAMDYFVFPRGALGPLPDFAVGRRGWDSWLASSALGRRIPVIDASSCITAVHQNHDFTHDETTAGDWKIRRYEEALLTPEETRNLELLGEHAQRIATTEHATFVLDREGLHARRRR